MWPEVLHSPQWLTQEWVEWILPAAEAVKHSQQIVYIHCENKEFACLPQSTFISRSFQKLNSNGVKMDYYSYIFSKMVIKGIFSFLFYWCLCKLLSCRRRKLWIDHPETESQGKIEKSHKNLICDFFFCCCFQTWFWERTLDTLHWNLDKPQDFTIHRFQSHYPM